MFSWQDLIYLEGLLAKELREHEAEYGVIGKEYIETLVHKIENLYYLHKEEI